ncbi:hypothetical protein SAMN05216299_109118 [Nitrosospira sp. Nsp14]|uniref:hypothetical protein n=1 Tax=Nitrosospira sp. Nsp14 TaxID=1855333 RepID=UPI0008E923E6|nr:hypothetical protein [Nitrosospira sp. Nsp14]SFH38289.1 hypothetical protein SAMN05216299_109118 [Nitrosospira sp. Nsp14]
MGNKQQQEVAKSEPEKYPRKAVQCEDGENGEKRGRNYARLVISPELAAHRIINKVEHESGVGEHIDVPTLMDILRDQAATASKGDLAQAEAMLMNQATALQSLFARLTEKAFSATHPTSFDSFIRVALRAQTQCRATLESLAAIKNPPTIYSGQTNIAHGHQQVNNAITAPLSAMRPGKNEMQQNELLEVGHGGEKMDVEPAGEAIRADSAMETVGAFNRGSNPGGQGKSGT